MKITGPEGAIISAENHVHYKRGEIRKIAEYYPASFRPPVFWYEYHGLQVPPEVRPPGKKPRSRKGVPNSKNTIGHVKNKRLEFRTTLTTLHQLEYIRQFSSICQHMTNAQIIERLIDDHVLMQQVMGNGPVFKTVKE